MKTQRLLPSVLAFGICSLIGRAADWPQWRGPERTGISGETGLLQQWPADGPKLLWRVDDIGDGYSTPSVCRVANLHPGQPRYGQRVRAGTFRRERQAGLDNRHRQGRQSRPAAFLPYVPFHADGAR